MQEPGREGHVDGMEREGHPRWALRLVGTFCPDHLLEEITGDLLQRFEADRKNGGIKKARRRFIWNAIRFCRPEIVFRNKFSLNLNQPAMVRNYFTTAWRNLVNNKFYSALNIAGLTLGLTVGLLILLWVSNELGYDSFHANADRLYRMNINLVSNGNKFSAPVVQAPITTFGVKEVPGIENAVRITDHTHYSAFRYKETALKNQAMVYTDPTLFKIFDYKLLEGNADKPFPDSHSIILSRSAATRFFGQEEPMGKVLLADNEINFTVTGIVEDFPENGWLRCDMLFTTDLMKERYTAQGDGSIDEDWGNYMWAVFLELQPGVSVRDIEDKLSQINYKHQPKMKPADAGSYSLQPLKELNLYSSEGNPTGITTVRIFSVVAALILLIASINYVNLSTARAMLRTREVGVRKVVGASRQQLFMQFVVQTLLFFIIAVVLAFGLMLLTMPLYNSLSGKHLQFDFLNPVLWKVTGITIALILLVSSIYPAMLLSSFNPASALKGKISAARGNPLFRKVLVVSQFTFSVGLIICTMIIGRQLDYVQEKSLGYDKSYVFSVDMNKMAGHYESARTELMSNPAIAGVTSANGNITQRWGATLDVEWDGKNPETTLFFHDLAIDKDFIPLFKLEMVSGAPFTGSVTDSSHFILNETAVRVMGITDPIGKRLRWHQIKGTITGVVRDFHFVSLKQKIDPFVFVYKPSGEALFVKASKKDIPEAIKAVEKIWTTYNPGAPFDYVFMDETYNKQYRSDEQTAKLFACFTWIAIAISCLGLLGLAAYTAQVRVKEIGIRKVLGASATTIALMLSRNFLVLVTISIAIAIPVASFVMNRWIQGFAYQTTLPWWIFALAGFMAIGIAMLTIGFQAIRAAVENPVKSLKAEG